MIPPSATSSVLFVHFKRLSQAQLPAQRPDLQAACEKFSRSVIGRESGSKTMSQEAITVGHKKELRAEAQKRIPRISRIEADTELESREVFQKGGPLSSSREVAAA